MSRNSMSMLHNFEHDIKLHIDINRSVKLLCEVLKCSAEGMKNNSMKHSIRNQPTWWDEECQQTKKIKYEWLNKFRMVSNN